MAKQRHTVLTKRSLFHHGRVVSFLKASLPHNQSPWFPDGQDDYKAQGSPVESGGMHRKLKANRGTGVEHATGFNLAPV